MIRVINGTSPVRTSENAPPTVQQISSPGVMLFAQELARARKRAGLTQEALAEQTSYSPSLVAQVETRRKTPTVEFARAADAALDTDGLLERLVAAVRGEDSQPWGNRSWIEIEAEATSLITVENTVVPGLLQTERYASVLLRNATDQDLASRLARQSIFRRTEPPWVVAIIDELALRRIVGGSEVMVEQLQYLQDCPATVQVVPNVPHRLWNVVDGPVSVATVDGKEYAWVDTPASGLLIDDPGEVGRMKRHIDAVRAEALPVPDSIALIEKIKEGMSGS